MAQLIVQVAGRAWCRRARQGHHPDPPGRPSTAGAAYRAGYFAFAEQALDERRAAGLPPYSHLALLRAEAHKPGQAEGFLDEACAAAERLVAEQRLPGIELLGPWCQHRWSAAPGASAHNC